MTLYPRTRLSEKQADAIHARFLTCGGECDVWVEPATGNVTLTTVGDETRLFLTRHMYSIETGALRLVQW
jgi:xanthine/CO dehydrogenase XdhC/CoxF family maturation factor